MSDKTSHPETIPPADNPKLGDKIFAELGAKPSFQIDGGAAGGNEGQRVIAQRKYLAWVYENLRYIPTSCPEELILHAEGLVPLEAAGRSQKCKAILHNIASDALGRKANSEQTDSYEEMSLARCKADSAHLIELRDTLTAWLASVR